jgi:DNA-binding IclR family transcriptional regulator
MSDSVKKAFRIIRHLAENGEALSLASVSRDLAINKATALRYLGTLEELDAVERCDGGYRLGLALYELGNRVAVKRVVIARIDPFMRGLCEEVNETVNLARIYHDRALYLHKIESRRSLQMRSDIGSELPLYCTALGKAILAAVEPGRLRALVAGMTLKSHTPATITSKAGLRREIEAVRRKGYAADREEFEVGLTCIAAPLVVPEHDFYGAISISAPTLRMGKGTIRVCAGKLQRTCDIVRRALLSQSRREVEDGL